jgi:hypothetical protein
LGARKIAALRHGLRQIVQCRQRVDVIGPEDAKRTASTREQAHGQIAAASKVCARSHSWSAGMVGAQDTRPRCGALQFLQRASGACRVQELA